MGVPTHPERLPGTATLRPTVGLCESQLSRVRGCGVRAALSQIFSCVEGRSSREHSCFINEETEAQRGRSAVSLTPQPPP